MHLAIPSSPSPQILGILAKIDEWQFDSFGLERASSGRPLSLLAFTLMTRLGLAARFGLDETKLTRFLMRIEDGYPPNPYHCRWVMGGDGGPTGSVQARVCMHGHLSGAAGGVGGVFTMHGTLRTG